MSEIGISSPIERSAGHPSLDLGQGDVRVWFAELDQPEEIVRLLSDTIDPEEYRRAMRFRFQHDRRRFIVARAILRKLLALYLAIEPRQVSFQYGPFGKPFLTQHSGEKVQFNLSHSDNGALFVMANDRKVGIDLELVRPLFDMPGLASNCFTASENAALTALPEQYRLRTFFDVWTRKEAFLKATGSGLSLSTTSIEVSPIRAPDGKRCGFWKASIAEGNGCWCR